MKKPNLIKIAKALAKIHERRRASQREAYAKFTDMPRLEHVYSDRRLRSALEMDLKSASIAKLQQTNCLWLPKHRAYRSLK